MAAVMLLAGAGDAMAQMSREPFQFRGRGIGDGVGMSQAYRQAILLQRLEGNLRNPLARDAAGNLLLVERRDGQAFLRTLEGTPVPTPRRSFTPTGLGWGNDGLGWSPGGHVTYATGGGGWSGGMDAGSIYLTWSSMIGGEDAGGPLWTVMSGSAPSASVALDSWIAQL